MNWSRLRLVVRVVVSVLEVVGLVLALIA